MSDKVNEGYLTCVYHVFGQPWCYNKVKAEEYYKAKMGECSEPTLSCFTDSSVCGCYEYFNWESEV